MPPLADCCASCRHFPDVVAADGDGIVVVAVAIEFEVVVVVVVVVVTKRIVLWIIIHLKVIFGANELLVWWCQSKSILKKNVQIISDKIPGHLNY